MPKLHARRYTTLEAAQLTGASARQLQWWDEQGIVVAQRDGRRRLYRHGDLAEILLIEELRLRHVSLQRIRKVLRFLRQEAGQPLEELIGGRGQRHLLIDGKHIYLETEDRQIVNLLKNARQAVFVVCLSDGVRQLQARLKKLSSAPAGDKKDSGKEKRTKGASGLRAS